MESQNLVFCGLGTLTLVAPTTGLYFVDGKSSLPTLTAGGGESALVTTVNLNGSPVYAGKAGAQGFYIDMLCTAFDVITVVFTSSADADQPINAIKTAISWGLGE